MRARAQTRPSLRTAARRSRLSYAAEVPFETTVLEVTVTVTGVTHTSHGLVADCARGRHRQAIGVLDLPLPQPPPKGAEWIAAYRRWTR
jgi:hypothetical protein